VFARVGNDSAASFVVLQESLVHAFPSLQAASAMQQFGICEPGWQTPLTQVSGDVQTFPSVHAVPFVFAGFEHTPDDVLHVPTSWH
jgi:hypothetical protein